MVGKSKLVDWLTIVMKILRRPQDSSEGPHDSLLAGAGLTEQAVSAKAPD